MHQIPQVPEPRALPMRTSRRPSIPIQAKATAPADMPVHDERFTARLPRAEKSLLQRAAQRSGMSLSAYVFAKARSAAVGELEEAGEIILVPSEQQRFVQLLLNPPKPTSYLLRALKAAEPLVARR